MPTLEELWRSLAIMIDSLAHRLQYADASDFGMLAVAVIVTCWYISRYAAE